MFKPVQYAAFIRHGDYCQRKGAPSAFQPFPLNVAGQQQAASAVSKIQAFCQQNHLHIQPTIHSSVMLRAWQTASIITEQLHRDTGADYEVTETVRLGERCVGSLANLTVDEIEPVVQNDPRYETLPKGWKSDSDYCLPYPGAESLMMAGQRVADYAASVINNISANSAAANSLHLFIGHGAAFRHAAYHLGVLERHKIATLSMYHARPVFFKIHPDGQWVHAGGDWKIRERKEQYTD